MRIIPITLLFLILPLLAFTQSAKLAQQYYQNGEFEKAASVYEKLYEQNSNDYYFNRYIDCLLALEEFEKGEEIVQRQLKKKPKEIYLMVTLGNIYERQLQPDKADKQYEEAIKKMTADRFVVTKLANAFIGLTKYDMAIATYERGMKLLKDKNIFAYNLGDLYRRKGDTPKMIESYLNSLSDNANRMGSLKAIFQRNLFAEEDYVELQTQLYERIQEQPEKLVYPELLTWVFIQKKDYRGALRQVKALDRKLEENGGRIYDLAEIAANDKDYDTAIDAFEYIVSEKGQGSAFYIEAKREALSARRNKLVSGFTYTNEDLRELEQQYESFLNEFGYNRATASIIASLADLEAFYLKDLDKAIALLGQAVDFTGLNKQALAEIKLSLGDFYLMKSEQWESTLLYSQVDKAHQDDILGHEARFRNAKLSYYTGDFQWAQAQFDILKSSTSKLIANDALDLSIFIMDNLGLDTTAVPLQLYADAELLVFQNNFDKAFLKMDSIRGQFPEHSLDDDILYLQSKIYTGQRQYDKAEKALQTIIEEHGEEIRADNAMYDLARLYEDRLEQPERAKELYERIFIEFSGSTYAVDARKRFRKLRGDDVQ